VLTSFYVTPSSKGRPTVPRSPYSEVGCEDYPTFHSGTLTLDLDGGVRGRIDAPDWTGTFDAHPCP
jgi:hypothetical protein